MICHERKFIFIHMCRCAGSSIEVYFGKDLNELNLSGERHATPAHYKAYWHEYFTFTIARNPWDRVYSAFLYTLQRDLRDTPLKERLHSESAGDFKTFINTILSDKRQFDDSDDRLFWPQCRWLMEGGKPVAFDRILRLETLDRELNSIAGPLGLGSFNLPRTNESARHDYRSAYDGKTADMVGRIYADDISLLGYQFD